WERIQVNLFRISVKGQAVGQIQQVGSIFFNQMTNVVISFIAAKCVVEGSMTLGMMVSLTYIVGALNGPVNSFIGFIRQLQDAKISLERLNEIHCREDEEQTGAGRAEALVEGGDIRMERVWFSYDGAERNYVLKDVSLTIPAGKVTAIVGSSGGGKTTLMKLLLGFYKPLRGEITVGGRWLEEINPHTWRGATGAVMQEGFIFSDSIAGNIAMDSDEGDMARIAAAAETANLREFVDGLPLGYHTKIGMEGNGISQGQRQRILIARTVYKNPRYIFFDEATNALDANNEREIMGKLKDFYRGRTVVVVAHRLSTVRDADNIVVLDKGEIAEQGTHAELIARKGLYYTLIKNQLELGL
ncbi:MAG: ATP-binding cassette domain-containing protein, partial [Paramuribaculum sp.]|nr:ATP-binding cassette domain-containing protein [Paramuribaculum sp.]